jgi:D-glycero-D-manno-heptose 1,7-bisphosphate phosphatase
MADDTDPKSHHKAVFLDRDGVINRKLPENAYVREPAEFEFLPGVIQALSIMRKLGFLLVVTTNQRGIGRGLMTDEDLKTVHLHMAEELRRNGIELDGVYYCPHEAHEQCGCRKPEPGMLFAATDDLCVDLAHSYMVGDSPSDIAAGQRAGTHTVRIGSPENNDADLVFGNLLEFALFLQKSRERAKAQPSRAMSGRSS